MLGSLTKFVAVMNFGIITRSKFVFVEKSYKNLIVLETFLRVGLLKAFYIKKQSIKVIYKFSGHTWHNILYRIDFVSTKSRKVHKTLKGMNYEARRFWGDYLMTTPLGIFMYGELLQYNKIAPVSGIVILKIHYAGGVQGLKWV